MSVLVERHIMDFHGMQKHMEGWVEKSEYSLHPPGTNAQSLYEGPAQKSNIHILPQEAHTWSVFIQYWPLLVPMGSKDYRNPALIIFRATLTRSLELKEQHCSAKKELTKVTLAKIQLLLDYSTSTSTTYQFLGNFKVLVETFVEVMGCSHDIADSAPTEFCTTFHCPCVCPSQAWHFTFLTCIKA